MMLSKLHRYLSLARELSSVPGNKSFARQLFEWGILFLHSRLGPGFYIQARMYQSDTSFSQIVGYYSTRQYKKRVYEWNNRLYHRCSQNKVVEKAILTSYGIPTPELLGHFHPERGLTREGGSLRNLKELLRLMSTLKQGSRLCFKLTESWGGNGFRAIELNKDGLIRDMQSGVVQAIEDYARSLVASGRDGFLIERYIEQHPDYAALNSSSVNTIRCVVMMADDVNVECRFAFLRVGAENSLVDNATSGGTIYPIDLEKRRLLPGFKKKTPHLEYTENPVTGETMAGRVVPMLTEAIDLSKRALLAFPGIRFSGTDIAFSMTGPVVLEMNILPDYGGFAYNRVPSQSVLIRRKHRKKFFNL